MKYFLGFLAVIVFVVLVFILVLKGFSGSSKPKDTISLLDYANSETVVRLTMDGPINADQDHEGYRITIGRDANTIEVLHSYKNDVINAKTYPSNNDAYAEFLRALQLLNFTKGNTDPKLADPRGYCPNGQRFTYEIQANNGDEVQKFWNSSCGGGTFRGNSGVRSLFQRQIPDFSKITTGIGY